MLSQRLSGCQSTKIVNVIEACERNRLSVWGTQPRCVQTQRAKVFVFVRDGHMMARNELVLVVTSEYIEAKVANRPFLLRLSTGAKKRLWVASIKGELLHPRRKTLHGQSTKRPRANCIRSRQNPSSPQIWLAGEVSVVFTARAWWCCLAGWLVVALSVVRTSVLWSQRSPPDIFAYMQCLRLVTS